MIKNMAWNTFKKTGNIDTFLELVEVANMEKNMKVDLHEHNQNERYNNCREQFK